MVEIRGDAAWIVVFLFFYAMGAITIWGIMWWWCKIMRKRNGERQKNRGKPKGIKKD